MSSWQDHSAQKGSLILFPIYIYKSDLGVKFTFTPVDSEPNRSFSIMWLGLIQLVKPLQLIKLG